MKNERMNEREREERDEEVRKRDERMSYYWIFLWDLKILIYLFSYISSI
jgi:hypothetical protein